MHKQKNISSVLKAFFIPLFVLLSACGQQHESVSQNLATDLADNVGCSNYEDSFYEALYEVAREAESLPHTESVRRYLKMSSQPLNEAVLEAYDLLQKQSLQDNEPLLKTLSCSDLHDTSTSSKLVLQQKLQTQFQKIHVLAQADGSTCPDTNPPPPPSSPPTPPQMSNNPYLDSLFQSRPRAVYGAHKVLATAYQSCGALDLTPMDSTTPTAKGISVVGKYPGGTGQLREITDLPALLRTHYYMKDHRLPDTQSCFDVEKSPLIYDYGGKPKVTLQSSEKVLDLFQNATSTTKTLGIDCSGYVYTSLATAGMKFKKEKPLRPEYVHCINAAMMASPERNGLSCLQPATFDTQISLQPGDIVASSGHVVMVDRIGADPFGLSHIQRLEDCKAANINYLKFDFTIAQSSPSKGAVGINRHEIVNYLQSSSTYRTGLEKWALRACKARFGQVDKTAISGLSVVRHKDEPGCYEKPVQLARESCLSTCGLAPILR